MRIAVLHDEPLVVPPDLPAQVRILGTAHAVAEVEADTVVVWGRAPAGSSLAGLRPTRALLSPSRAFVDRARDAGWHAVLLPDLAPDTLARALRGLDGLVPLAAGTWVPDGELWCEGRVVPLPPRERLVLAALLAAGGAPVARPVLARALAVPQRSRAVDAALHGLRRRFGADHVVNVRGRGWRFLGRPRGPAERAPVPRVAVRVGALAIDLDGQRVARDGRVVRLGQREAAVLGELVRARGPVDRRTLAIAAWGRPVPSARLDVVMCRLRGKVGADALETLRGRGWRLRGATLVEGGPSDPATSAVLDRLELGRLVTLVGPPGAGKSRLAAEVARRGGGRVVDAHGLDTERAVRAARRYTDRLLVLDGLDDPARCGGELVRLAAGRRLLLTARAPVGLADEVVLPVALGPDPEPLEETSARMRLLDRPTREALAALSAFRAAFDVADARAVAGDAVDVPDLARRSLLAGTGPYHLLEPIRLALGPLRAEAADRRHANHVISRTRSALAGRPYAPERVAAGYADLAAAHEHLRGRDPVAAARCACLRADVASELGLSYPRDWFDHADDPAVEPAVRAELWYHASTAEGVAVEERLAALRRCHALPADPTIRQRALVAEWLWVREHDPTRTRALLAELEREAASPTGAVVARSRLVIAQALRRPMAERAAPLVEVLLEVERARWSDESATPHRLVCGVRATAYLHLGYTLLALGREDAARDALAEAERGAPWIADDVRSALSMLEARVGRWAEADRVLERAVVEARRAGRVAGEGGLLVRRALYAVLSPDGGPARALLEQAEEHARRHGWTYASRTVAWVRAVHAALAGRPDEADAAVVASGDDDRTTTAIRALARALRARREGDAVAAEVHSGLVADLLPAVAEARPLVAQVFRQRLAAEPSPS